MTGTNAFKCLIICGRECCTFRSIDDAPLVFPWEKRLLERRAKALNLEKPVFIPYAGYVSGDTAYILLYRWSINGECPFLRGNKCSIHRDKPIACKMYPLIIGWGDNTLRVSGNCPWITQNMRFIRSGDPRSLFPEELPHALRAFAILSSADSYAKKKDWSKVIGGDLSSYSKLVDIDEAIDIK